MKRNACCRGSRGRAGRPCWRGVDLDGYQLSCFDDLAARRVAGEPLQYLEGTAPFGPIELAVDWRALIPRPETEQLWERAMQALAPDHRTVVDLCTGSGCIALATKHQRPDIRVIATDLSEEALSLARNNAEALGLDVAFRHGDLLDALYPELRGRVDLFVTNPPYVSPAEWDALPPDVRNHEPRMALVADEDGLAFFRRLASGAGEWLGERGVLVAEIGETQGDDCDQLFSEQGWRATVAQDLNGRDRFLTAWMAR